MGVMVADGWLGGGAAWAGGCGGEISGGGCRTSGALYLFCCGGASSFGDNVLGSRIRFVNLRGLHHLPWLRLFHLAFFS